MKKRLKNIVSPYFSGLGTIFSDTKIIDNNSQGVN